jgi:hypothetical protein
LASSNGVKGKKRKVARNLTSQQLTGRFNYTNKKGVALFQMYNSSRQTRHLILEYGYLCQIAICAWRFAKDKRLSRSEILEEYSVHRQEGQGGDEAPELTTLTGDVARSRPNDPPA